MKVSKAGAAAETAASRRGWLLINTYASSRVGVISWITREAALEDYRKGMPLIKRVWGEGGGESAASRTSKWKVTFICRASEKR